MGARPFFGVAPDQCRLVALRRPEGAFKSERVGPFNNHVARKWKLGPVQGIGGRPRERENYIREPRPPPAVKKLQQKIPDDVLKEFYLAARDCDTLFGTSSKQKNSRTMNLEASRSCKVVCGPGHLPGNKNTITAAAGRASLRPARARPAVRRRGPLPLRPRPLRLHQDLGAASCCP